jgi:hypothetical protein
MTTPWRGTSRERTRHSWSRLPARSCPGRPGHPRSSGASCHGPRGRGGRGAPRRRLREGGRPPPRPVALDRQTPPGERPLEGRCGDGRAARVDPWRAAAGTRGLGPARRAAPCRSRPSKAPCGLEQRGQDEEMSRPKRTFPGFDQCMRMMKGSDPQMQEDGFHSLLPHAADFVPALIEAFEAEADHGLKCWLLELIGEARSGDAFGLLAAQLRGSDEALRYWAIRGLESLGDERSRRLLWDARSWEWTPEPEREDFLRELDASRERTRAHRTGQHRRPDDA